MTHPCFFGYGSLVNRATHDYPNAAHAQATGWRRVWRHTSLRPVAYLTVERASGVSIDGLIAQVPGADWAALDERERAYDRLPASADITHTLPTRPEVAIYAVPDGKHAAPHASHPILLSYLDVVVQGYLREFGPDGARRFFDTTLGWDAPILNDRADPKYPRHQRLTKAEATFVDEALNDLSARVKHL